MDIECLAQRDSDSQNAKDSIEKSKLWHLQGAAELRLGSVRPVHRGEIPPVPEVLDLVVAARSERDQRCADGFW